MSNIVIGSAFRNSAGRQITNWLDQIVALRDHMSGDCIRVIAVEGDSVDATRQHLTRGAIIRALDLDLRTCNHGGPVFGSIESPVRFKALAKVGTEILRGVAPDDDILVYIESDLIWSPQIIADLVALTLDRPNRVVAPLIFAGNNFYDVWAFRKDGSQFSPFPPYHSGMKSTGLVEVDSIGSCLVMSARAAEEVAFGDNHLLDWCLNARKAGYQIFVSADHSIRHPA